MPFDRYPGRTVHAFFVTLGALISTTVIASCGGDPDMDRASPEDTTTSRPSIAHVRNLGTEEPFGAIVSVAVTGDLMFVSDIMAQDHIIVIDLSTNQIIDHLGRNGQGPGEYRSPSITGLEMAGPSSFRLSVFDSRSGIFDQGTYRPGEGSPTDWLRRQVADAGSQLQSVVPLQDGMIGNGMTGDPRLVVFDAAGAVARRINVSSPFDTASVGDAAIRNVNYFSVARGGNRAVVVFQNQPSGWIVNLSDGSQVELETVDVGQGASSPDGSGYWGVRLTDQYVYVLFKRAQAKLPQAVRVFNWNGELVADLDLDGPVLSFDVAGDSLLYAGILEPVPAMSEYTIRIPR